MVHFGFIFTVSLLGELCSAISCTDVKEKGSGSAFVVEDLKSLATSSAEDIKECIIFLGKEALSQEQSKTIWSVLIKIFASANNIPEDSLQHLGWITDGIEPEHFYNLTLTEVETIEAFGRCSSLSKDQLYALHTAVFEQWNSKEIEDLSSFDLMALRQILCAFNGSDILRIHPDAYKDAAPELATLKNCSADVFEGLATLASSPLAFGDPKSWTSLQVATIGCVVAGLPSISVIPAEAMEGFTKDTITCLAPQIIKELSNDHLMNLSPSAAGSLTPKQLSALYQSQKYALEIAVKGLPYNDKSKAIRPKSVSLMGIVLVILIIPSDVF